MSSKYDFVKIKVQLQEENYFILSRFLLSKMLLFCQVPPSLAVRVSLEVKKHFVDAGELQITEHQLRHQLFITLKAHGCGDSYITLFNRISEFQTARVPIIVFIAGTGCCGKSSVAQMLGSKLSNFHIINTDLVLDTLHAIDTLVNDGGGTCSGADLEDIPLPSCDDMNEVIEGGGETDGHLSTSAFWISRDGGGRALSGGSTTSCGSGALEAAHESSRAMIVHNVIAKWKDACATVATSIQGEIRKALREGKAVIVEGTFINLADYASYILPKDMEEKINELNETAKKEEETRACSPASKPRGRRSKGRPIVLSCLMLLPQRMHQMVLRLWLREQHHKAALFTTLPHPNPAVVASLDHNPMESIDVPRTTDGDGVIHAPHERSYVPSPPDVNPSFIPNEEDADDAAHDAFPGCAQADAEASKSVEHLLRAVQSAHVAEVDAYVSQTSGERLSQYVFREVFDVRRTVDVAASLHEELLRCICCELDRQQHIAEAGTNTTPSD